MPIHELVLRTVIASAAFQIGRKLRTHGMIGNRKVDEAREIFVRYQETMLARANDVAELSRRVAKKTNSKVQPEGADGAVIAQSPSTAALWITADLAVLGLRSLGLEIDV